MEGRRMSCSQMYLIVRRKTAALPYRRKAVLKVEIRIKISDAQIKESCKIRRQEKE